MVGNPRRGASKRNTERRRALELLAASPDGCTEAIILAHGFTTDFLVDLIRAGARSRWRTLDAGYPHADHRRRTTSAWRASMALILKRASPSRASVKALINITRRPAQPDPRRRSRRLRDRPPC